MPDSAEIAEKLSELKTRRYKQRRKEYLSCLPINCVFNSCQRVKGVGKVRFCTNRKVLDESGKKLFVCDTKETSEGCGHYSCKHTEESVSEDFNRILKSPSMCGSEYPKLAILIWCLSGSKSTTRMSRFSELLKRLFTLTWW